MLTRDLSGEVPQEIQLQLDATSSDANRLRGIYARQGEHNGKVMYQKVDGDATIFFDGQWKIGVRGVLFLEDRRKISAHGDGQLQDCFGGHLSWSHT